MSAIARLLSLRCLVLAGLAVLAAGASAQTTPPSPPSVTVTAAATSTVPNDRLQAWMRAEAEDASPAAAASQANVRVAKALSDAGIPAGKIQAQATPVAGGGAAGRVDIRFAP